MNNLYVSYCLEAPKPTAVIEETVRRRSASQMERRRRRLSRSCRAQREAANIGFPAASLISLAQTSWIADTTLSGIGT